MKRELMRSATLGLGLVLAACSGQLVRTGDADGDGEASRAPDGGGLESFTPNTAIPVRQERLLAALGDRVVEIDWDGSQRTLVELEAGSIETLAARGSRIAVAGRDELAGPWVLLLDGTGRELWRFDTVGESYWLSALELLADGTLIIDLAGVYVPGRLIARRPDGTEHELTDVYVQGLGWEAGLVPVQLAGAAAGELVLWSALTGETRALAYVPTDNSRWSLWRAMAGGAAVYVTDLAGDLQLVVERTDGSELIDIPEVEGLSVADAHEAGWVLLHTWESDELVWVDLIARRVVAEALTLPAGLEILYPFEGPRLDSAGGLLLGLRDANVAAAYRSLDAIHWTRLGATVDQVLDVTTEERSGTYVAAATNYRYSYQEWPADSTADISGEAVMVSRPAANTEVALAVGRTTGCYAGYDELAAVEISADGTRVAIWQTDESGLGSVIGVDAASGEQRLLASAIDLRHGEAYCAGRAQLLWVR